MNKNIFFLLLAFFCFTITIQGQSSSTTETEKNNEYRSVWNTLIKLGQSKQYPQTIQEGVRLSKIFSQNKKYKEALATCHEMDDFIRINEKETSQPNYQLRYEIAKERLRLYTSLKNIQNSKVQLNILHYCASQIKSLELDNELLLTEANFYQTFGMTTQSHNYYKQYISKKTKGKNLDNVDQCYKDLLSYAQQNQNPSMTNAITDLYSSWKRSIQEEKNAQEYKFLQKKYDDCQTTLQEKDKSITAKWVIISTLGILCIVFVIGIIVLLSLLFKQTRHTKKLTNNLTIANENNELKSKFIENMKNQIDPALNTIAETHSDMERNNNINALKNLMTDIQTYLSLEKTQHELYISENIPDIYSFCEKVMKKVKDELRPEIETLTNASHLEIKANIEVLEHILYDLLTYLGKQDGTTKIILEFKKRSAHSGQFILTAHGYFIPEKEKENLFKPFAEIQDITKGDVLLLPRTNLIAAKLNGTLSFDNEYRKGTRFILLFHGR